MKRLHVYLCSSGGLFSYPGLLLSCSPLLFSSSPVLRQHDLLRFSAPLLCAAPLLSSPLAFLLCCSSAVSSAGVTVFLLYFHYNSITLFCGPLLMVSVVFSLPLSCSSLLLHLPFVLFWHVIFSWYCGLCSLYRSLEFLKVVFLAFKPRYR